MRKLVYVLFVLLVFTAISSYAFGADKLTVWVGGHVVEQEQTWKDIIDSFEKKFGVKVEYQLIGFDVYYDRLVAAFEAGEGPDVSFADLGGWVPTFAAKGWLEPMDKYLNNADVTKQIWPNLWPTVTYNGKRYGLPWYTDCRLLLYNNIMFKDAGLNPEKPPKTWADLLSYAQKLTDENKQIYGYGVSGKKSEVATLGYMMFLYSNGSKLLDDNYKKAVFNNKNGIEALEFYTDLYKKYHVSPPGTPSYGEDDYRSMMAQNRVAMAIGGPWSFPLIELANPDIKGNYSVAIHPYGKKPASVLGGWASVISTTCKDKELAWKFIDYITSYDVWMMWIERHNGPMPTRKDVCANAPGFKDKKWQVVLSTFPYAGVRPPIPTWPQVSEQIQLMIQKVLTSDTSASKAIAEASKAINSILSK